MTLSSPTSHRRPRGGFSFAEVMFAVIILGVGFIMIAALFPVAIRQSKSTVDETSAAAAAIVAKNDIDTLATDANLAKIGASSNTISAVALPTISSGTTEFPFTTALWQSVRGNIISATDPRYAWVPFYVRGMDANGKLPYAQLILICVQSTAQPEFTSFDVVPRNPLDRANLRGRPVRVTIFNSAPPDPDLIGFTNETSGDLGLNGTGTNPSATDAVAEGCFVIIRANSAAASLVGHIYRVGARRADLDGVTLSTMSDMQYTNTGTFSQTSTKSATSLTGKPYQMWELMPGSDFDAEFISTPTGAAVNSPTNAAAWIVGRSFADPNDVTKGFEGPAMDVSAYSTIVFCKP